MKPVETPSTNTILTAPKGQENSVFNLPVTRYTMQTPDGDVDCVMSCWELSPEELEKFKETGSIYFHMYGNTHPPMMLTPYPLEDLANVKPKE